MEPVIKRPEKLAKERLTSKVRYQRNIDLIAALKSGNRSMVAAIEYMKKGFSLDDSTGVLLDAWGEQYSIKREGRDDDDYRKVLQQARGEQSVSTQSRPSVGAYMQQVYDLVWLPLSRVGLTTGATGAAFNRVPLRTVFVQCGGMAPDIELPDSLVSVTFGGDIYSAATPPNVQLTNHAPMFPGNAFPCVWAGIRYERTQKTIRATESKGIRIRAVSSLLTRIDGTATVNGGELITPFNTLVSGITPKYKLGGKRRFLEQSGMVVIPLTMILLSTRPLTNQETNRAQSVTLKRKNESQLNTAPVISGMVYSNPLPSARDIAQAS